MKKFAKNHPFWMVVITVALCLLVVGIVSPLTKSFTDFNPWERNEANLLAVGEDGNFLEKIDGETSYGLTVSMDEKGIVKIDGDNSAQSVAKTVTLTKEITLEAGKTYTLTTGKKGVNKDAYAQGKGINVFLYGTTDAHYADNGGLNKDGTFTIPADATDLTYVLKISVYPGEYSNVSVYPVLVEGDTAASFYD